MVVALVRGVNVGGHNKLAMRELEQLVVGLGHTQVRTYIQSGNVVFYPAPGGSDETLVASLQDGIATRCGITVTVILRRAGDLQACVDGNPYHDVAGLYVVFLASTPTAAAVQRLDPQRSPPDTFVVQGQHVYLRYPHGSGRSKLTLDYLERILGTRGTARNWNTVKALLAMATPK